MQQRPNELKNTTYELFIAVVSIISVVNLVLIIVASDPMVRGIVSLMNGLLTVLFLGDFVYRLLSAESRRHYFLREYGWADLLAGTPFTQTNIMRVFRLVRAIRLMRRYGLANMVRDFREDRAGSALLSVLLLLFLLLEFGGLAVYKAESASPNANIVSASDAIWFTYVTMTTVGYGDRYPVTTIGRVVGMIVMAAGVGLFGALTGFVTNAFLAPRRRRPVAISNEEGMEATLAQLRALLDESKTAQTGFEEKLATLESQVRAARLSSTETGGEGGIRTPEPGKPD
ncbi:MAG: ion channel [Thermoleophilia bacterium]